MQPNPYQLQIFELQRLLNINSGLEIGMKHPISQTVEAIDRYHRAGKKFDRDTQLGKIYLLIAHLQRIEKHSSELLEHFREKLKKTTDREYFGERLEINIAATLIKKKILFTKSESPDFKKVDNKDINIECTSTHLTSPITSDKGLENKLRKVIVKKARKNFSNLNTALFVDVTNLCYSSLGIDSKIFRNSEVFKSKISKKFANTSFGSLIAFTYLFENETKRYHSTYNRVDNDKIDKNLRIFLDKAFPFGQKYIDEFKVPEQG